MPVGVVGFRRAPGALVRLVWVGAVIAASVRPVTAQTPAPRVEERPLGRGIPVYLPVLGESERRDAATFVNPTGAISLREALALALLHNPALATFAWESRALEARILQVGRRPNPTLDLMAQDFGAHRTPGSDADQPVQPQATIQLSQLIELGGKRTARQDLATLNRDLASWDYEAARIDVFTEVSRAFTAVLAAQETVALSEQAITLVTQVQQSVDARVDAGVVSPIEATRAGVALASARADAARARRALDASRTRLALLWGSPTAAFSSATGDLTAEPPPLPAVSALTVLLDQNPELARWAAEMAQREAGLALERSKRVVDVAVSAGYRRFTTVDSNAFVVGASVPLPLFNRNAGGIEEARIRVAKGHEERRAAEARVAAALADAYAALAAAHDEITLVRTDVLPGAQQTFDAISEGYQLGRFGFLDVLEAQRTLMNARGQHLRALSAYYDAAVTVERLIGAPLPGSPRPPSSARE
jgi:outer membrane protein, heavy metal efflux system